MNLLICKGREITSPYVILEYVPNFDHLQDGAVTVEEFQTAVQSVCLDKEYDDLPSAFKQFITAMFNTIDTDGRRCKSVSTVI